MQKSFSDFIRDRRRLLNLTQRQVAEALGLKSIAFLSDIEAGNRKPSRELFPALAQILQTDVETLKSHDIRSPLAEARTLLEAHPEYAVAFRRVVEHSRDLGADEVLRRIESISNEFPGSKKEFPRKGIP
jgi:transcriptional regulator with XRE-family HTH domain